MEKVIKTIVEEISRLERIAIVESRLELWDEIESLLFGLMDICRRVKSQIKDVDGDAYYKDIRLPFDMTNFELHLINVFNCDMHKYQTT